MYNSVILSDDLMLVCFKIVRVMQIYRNMNYVILKVVYLTLNFLYYTCAHQDDIQLQFMYSSTCLFLKPKTLNLCLINWYGKFTQAEGWPVIATVALGKVWPFTKLVKMLLCCCLDNKWSHPSKISKTPSSWIFLISNATLHCQPEIQWILQ